MPQNKLSDFLTAQIKAQHLNKQLAEVVNTVAKAGEQIRQQVARGALAGILGSLGAENVQGETQQKLDVIANDILLDAGRACQALAGVASEEMDEAVIFERATGNQGSDGVSAPAYVLLFDPLDGSSNIDINAPIGTIFSVLEVGDAPLTEASFLQAGQHQVAAGYVIYGAQTQLVFTIGHGVVAFTFDPETNEWVLTQQDIRVPESTQEFAINMSNYRHWDAPVRQYIDECLAGDTGDRGKNFNMRWVASMVADVHRILMRGGIFMYPWDARTPDKPGKLRLLYEANPMSFLIEQAGGLSTDCRQPIMSITPEQLHQRVSVCLGAKEEVERVVRLHQCN